jgi:hypothetical protein
MGFYSRHRVVLAGAALIIVQLAFRGWALAGSWFQGDDFPFMSRIMNWPLKEALVEPYAGHLMPAGFLLSWLNHQISPLNWALPAGELLVMQAVASAGCLAFLVSAFGPRAGVLPPLAVYLFSVISLPAFIWWAAGVNQMPLQMAFFWGLFTHLAYLRTRRVRYAVATMLITLFSLAFYEKTLLLFPVFAIFTLAYFAKGDIVERLRMIWARYRFAVVTYVLVAVAYTLVYVLWGLNFSVAEANKHPLGPIALRVAVWGFGTGILGGPLSWRQPNDLFSLAEPSELVVIIACIVLSAIGLEMVRTRTRAKRAWLIPGFLLVSDILLVVAGRSGLVGPLIAEDYRYQTELAGAAAVALGLSLLPLLGAVESAAPKRASAFFDKPKRVAAATVVVAGLGVVSSLQYTLHWQGSHGTREFFNNVERGLTARTTRVPLIDGSVPGYVVSPLGGPDLGRTSHMLRMFSDRTRYRTVATDRLFVIGESGEVAPVVIPPVREEKPGPARCGYVVRDSTVRIPLNGPVFGAGWWMRIGYMADGDSPVTVTAGERSHRTWVYKGFHSLYFDAAGRFDSIEVSGLKNGVTMCTDEVSLGMPEPARDRRD